ARPGGRPATNTGSGLMPELGHEFTVASGPHRGDCHWLGVRFDRALGFRPTEGESWIGQGRPEGHYALMSQRGWMTGLWRTEGRVWVSDSAGRVYTNPSLELRKAPWQTIQIDATLTGIWGLSDDYVFAWGLNRGKPVMFLYEGSAFRPV